MTFFCLFVLLLSLFFVRLFAVKYKIDGMSQWDRIRYNKANPRTEFVYNIDRMSNVAAVRYKTASFGQLFKLTYARQLVMCLITCRILRARIN